MNNMIFELPETKGTILPMHSLAKYTWFNVGGPADVLFIPSDKYDLISFIKNCPKKIPIRVIGAGSNILIRDGGIKGVTILTKNLNAITTDKETYIFAESGVLDMQISRYAHKHSLTDLEFLIGIPGSIGGAIIMNSGCFGKEIKDILIELEYIDRNGIKQIIPSNQLNLTYRNGGIPIDWIILSAKLKCKQSDKNKIKSKMKLFVSKRRNSQPFGAKTGGSTFKNPEGEKSWKLIEKSGCKGLKVGSAQISEKHCNFIINNGKASASEIENLGEIVRDKVLNKTGISLDWEIHKNGKNKRF